MKSFDGDDVTSLVQHSRGAEPYQKASDSSNGQGHNVPCNCIGLQAHETRR